MCTLEILKRFPRRLITLTMAIFCIQGLINAEQFKTYLDVGNFEMGIMPDSALKVLQRKYDMSIQQGDSISEVNALLGLSATERANKKFSTALDYAGEALFLAEEVNDVMLQAKAHEELGVLYFMFKLDQQSFAHFQKSKEFYHLALQKHLIAFSDMYPPYFNMTLYATRSNETKMALAYIDSCEQCMVSSPDAGVHRIYLNEKRAILLNKEGKYNEAIDLLHLSVQSVKAIRPIRKKRKHQSFLIVLYCSLANNYQQLGNHEKALEWYEKALKVTDLFAENTFYRGYVHFKFSNTLHALGQYERAYQNLSSSRQINETYLNPRNKKTQGYLTIKNRYQQELAEKEKQLSQKDLELANSKEKMLRNRVFFIAIIFILILFVLVIVVRNQRLKHQKDLTLKEKEKQHANEMLEHRNRELTSNMLQLIEKEEIVKKLSHHLTTNHNTQETKVLLKSIQSQSNNLWESFNSRFMELNSGFYERLQKLTPDLGPADLKICALIKLNFSGNEMAYLLGISIGSVHVARHRVRKKLNLDKDANLATFIHNV